VCLFIYLFIYLFEEREREREDKTRQWKMKGEEGGRVECRECREV
jgi:hypothetical protein